MHHADEPPDDVGGLITIRAAARQVGLVHTTLSRKIKAGLVRSHGGKVRLSEVIEDLAKSGGAGAEVRAPENVERRAKSSKTGAPPIAGASARAPQIGAPEGRAPDPLISIRAAAKEAGVSHTTIMRQVNAGAIRSHDGMVRLSEVLEDRLRHINLTKGKGRQKGTKVDKPVEGEGQGQLEMVLVDGKLLPFHQAQQLKENYLAKLRQLEYLTKSGALVDRAAAADLFFKLARGDRDAWQAWPSRIATLMAADLGVEERLLAEALKRYVQQHLAELGGPRAPEFLGTDGKPAPIVVPGPATGAEHDRPGMGGGAPAPVA
jgi:hypothetical protein